MGVTVRQKAKGKGKPWWVFVSHDGKRTSRRIGDKKAAEEVASTIRSKLQLGDFGFEEKQRKAIPTFKLYAEAFMNTYSAMNHKESTQESYRSALDLHILPYLGDMDLDAITRKDVKEFINEKNKDDLSAGTVRNLKAYLSAILSEAVDDELIQYNPASKTGKLIKKRDNKEISPLTWKEKAKLEETLEKHYKRYYPFFLTALRTGMRLGELIALKPGDLDFNGGFFEIRRSCSRGKITTPKSGKTRRVDMSKGLSEILKVYLTERKRETLKKGWKESPEWLFYNENGGIIDVNNIRKRIFYKALEKAKLRCIRIHDLRHTYATLRISKGDNILDVSKQLGHHSIRITLDTYAHWMPGGKKSEVDELDSKTEPDRNGSISGDAKKDSENSE
ncbi:tyrosine-type recombinase/integrase [Thermodesulfobacteriota bacterium]